MVYLIAHEQCSVVTAKRYSSTVENQVETVHAVLLGRGDDATMLIIIVDNYDHNGTNSMIRLSPGI